MFINERQFVRWLRQYATPLPSWIELGIGDDAALYTPSPNREVILTTDLTVEKIHYSPLLHPPEAVGHRALARCLSDIAAMGGVPRCALVSLVLPATLNNQWLRRFYAGFRELARKWQTALIGGDTTIHSGAFVADVVVVGEVESGRSLRRAGAKPGDSIFVSGTLGLSDLGLKMLARKGRGHSKTLQAAVDRHLHPVPRLPLGRYLAQTRLASAAMDISDGLSTDLLRLCEASKVGARLNVASIPAASYRIGRQPLTAGVPAPDDLERALHGGEDYELLFTVSPRNVSQVPAAHKGVPLTRIGRITQIRNIRLVRDGQPMQPLPPAGYDHFSKVKE